jgi:CTP:phosphocholine cytidylyltransferase-like protein
MQRSGDTRKLIGIVLSSRCVGETMAQIFGSINTGLVPLRGKPAIVYIIDRMKSIGIDDIYVTVGYERDRLIGVVNATVGRRVNVFFRETREIDGKKYSALEQIVREIQFTHCLINAADSVVLYTRDLIEQDVTTALISNSCDNFSPKISLSTDGRGNVTGFEFTRGNRNILVGAVYIAGAKKLKSYEGNFSLGALAEFCIRNYPVTLGRIDRWFCSSQIFKYYEARKDLLDSRFFNSFQYNDLRGTVTKRSTDSGKLRREILWFLNLPKELSCFTPRILNYSIDQEVFVEMEYYGYASLSEIFVYGDFSGRIWESILRRLMMVLDEFRRFRGDIPRESFREIYYAKLLSRVRMLSDSNPFFLGILSSEKIRINGRSCYNLNHFLEKILQSVDELYSPADCTVIHGDYFFANILYDLNNGIVRLVDPRGEWGDSVIYGDSKYDVAKLSHSIHGNYDFIVNDMFELNYGSDFIDFRILNLKKLSEELTTMFDSMVAERHSVREIRLIESLLFISMVPLHADHPDRQLVQYATGIEMLNEVFYGK